MRYLHPVLSFLELLEMAVISCTSTVFHSGLYLTRVWLLSQEMMGLAYFMLDQSRKDAEYCMENALTTYLVIINLTYSFSFLW